MALFNFIRDGSVGQPQQVFPTSRLPTTPVGGATQAPAQGPLWSNMVGAQTAPAPALTGAQTVQGNLSAFMDPNSQLVQQARQRGAEYANTRGGLNSSIAAGAAERAVIENANALGGQATAIDMQREQTNMENWLNTQNFNRAMFGQFQQGAFQSSLGMLEMLQRASIEDPELYTPDIVSGMSNFFNMNMADQLKRYFGG